MNIESLKPGNISGSGLQKGHDKKKDKTKEIKDTGNRLKTGKT